MQDQEYLAELDREINWRSAERVPWWSRRVPGWVVAVVLLTTAAIGPVIGWLIPL